MTGDSTETALEGLPAMAGATEQAVPVGSESDEHRLRAEIDRRIAFLTSSEYEDPSTKGLNTTDYTWLIAVCVVIPVIALVWGMSML